MAPEPTLDEQADKLFKQSCDFVIGAVNVPDIPDLKLPEVAFIGRSNVGKSSLINALTNRKTLARTSQTPGRTRQINFFSLADKLMLVDLPGYGYAKASKKDVAGWQKLIYQYLQGRANLRRACLLIDARHGLKDTDKKIMKLLDDDAVSYQICLTKADKTKKEELDKVVKSIEDDMGNFPALHPEIVITSSRKQEGIAELRTILASFI